MHIVIIGSGVAGVSLAEKLRSLSSDVAISLVSVESDGYYSRPLLSRGFSKNDIEHTIILKSFDALVASGIKVFSNTEVTSIEPVAKSLRLLTSGHEQDLSYDTLILAQGSAAFIPPPYQPYADLFFCLNSLSDLKSMRQFRQKLLQTTQRPPHWAIIGGGLIGCEVASDLAVAGDQVTIFHAQDRLMERQLVSEDSVSLQTVLQASGVEVLLNQQVRNLAAINEKIVVSTDIDAEFDSLIVACGFKPRTALAAQAGLTVARGIKVNGFLQTNDPHIYALGDVAQLPDDKLYAFILPIRSQANWLAKYLLGQEQQAWMPPVFTTKAKVHGFEAKHPYNV